MVKVTLGDGSGKVGPARAVPWVGTLVVVGKAAVTIRFCVQRRRARWHSGMLCCTTRLGHQKLS
jgi:hypothetical protein